MYDHRQHQVCGDDGEDERIFLCARAENSQHCSRVITEQRSFAVWRLAIAFARRSSSVVSSECDDLHFDSAGNDSATINRYPTRRDYCKLLALLRTEKFSTLAGRPLRLKTKLCASPARFRAFPTKLHALPTKFRALPTKFRALPACLADEGCQRLGSAKRKHKERRERGRGGQGGQEIPLRHCCVQELEMKEDSSSTVHREVRLVLAVYEHYIRALLVVATLLLASYIARTSEMHAFAAAVGLEGD
eukprot:s1561_g4.t1